MDGSKRTWANALIAAFIAYQLVMPLSYYLGDHAYDERFSWRMFSTRRMARCQVRMTETSGEGGAPQEIALARELQVAWVNILRRYRPAAVDKFIRLRCEADGIASVDYTRTCFDTGGSPLPTVRHVMECAAGEVTVEELAP